MDTQADAQLNNVRSSYAELETRVRIALRTQVGDSGRLREVRSQALALGMAADNLRHIFPPGEYAILQDNLAQIVQDLDQACTQSVDPPDAAPLPIIQTIRTGRRGRPPKQIQRSFLEFALEMRGPKRIADLLGCSSRTVRREALRLGLAEPGPPVFTTTVAEDGTSVQQCTTVTPPVSDLTDEELDQAIIAILTTFPHFGRQMIAGNLRASGHRVPDQRIRASYLRVRGAPAVFGQRIIVRKKYQVPGPNSLVHHDGQHGLIRWKFVIHCFVDGHSRLVTGIGVHTNNRAATVLALFLGTIARHGCPSRVRGDHGTENLRVAEWMEEHKGLNRGSYIWGRSVHNTRIERLWYDVTRGFGLKWKTFFLDLERCCGLDPDRPGHIWLIHHLFLDVINEDALEWAETWNAHRLHIKGEQSASPRELFMFGMVQHGPRGIEQLIEPVDDQVEDISGYGVDWDVIDDPILMAHHNQHNPSTTTDDENPFAPVPTPDRLSQVTCDPPLCPLSPDKVAMLNAHLAFHFNLRTRDMLVRRQIWSVALDYCSRLQ